jgi:hypothetical protein
MDARSVFDPHLTSNSRGAGVDNWRHPLLG